MKQYQFAKEDYGQLPHDPGVYKFFNATGTLVYVGKAKDLKKRVSSYFTKGQQNNKTRRLVREIETIEFVIVNSEFDALLLENNLIKENQPKYNILLKDDKSFPYLLVTKERFPRIYSTRRVNKSIGKYYGPYTSVKAMNNVLELITKLYKLRTCNYNLSKSNIQNGKFKVCLEYHIKNCLGPCEGLQDEHSYMDELNQAVEILKGRSHLVKVELKKQMDLAASSLQFEIAQSYKSKLELLDKFQTKSLIVNQSITDLDVCTSLIDEESQTSFVNFMKIQHGTIRQSETIEVKSKLDESHQEIMEHVVPVLQEKFQSTSKVILTNLEFELLNHEVVVPQIGDKRKLIDLSVKNVLMFKQDKLRKNEAQRSKPNRVLEQLQKDLQLQDLPDHIECFDNSNIQGTNPVASMVCFRNGKPSKKDYRHYNIKTVVGPDDFGSMKEIVGRRYKRLQEESLNFPKLIVIDGGKGQLNAACEALRSLNLYSKIPIVGIAKRLEEIYFPEDQYPLHISKKSESLKLLQFLRDEAHRFAITFHRQKRSINSYKSALDEVPGIGPKLKQRLLEQFKNLNGLEKAGFEELTKVIGQSKASILFEFLRTKKGNQN